jgi:hypothetical protein
MYVQDDVHGFIHFTFGGAGGERARATDAMLQSDYAFSDDDLILTSLAAQTFFKQNVPK